MSIETLSDKQREEGSAIARRGYELSRRASEITNSTLRGEDSLAGGIAGLWRQDALIAENRNGQLEVLGNAVELLDGVFRGQEVENSLERAREIVSILVESNGDVHLDNPATQHAEETKDMSRLRTALALFPRQEN